MFRNLTRNKARNTTAGMIGLALTGLVLSGSAFAMQPLSDTDKDAPVSRTESLAIAPSGAAHFAKKDVNADGANAKALPRGLSRLRRKR